MASADSVPTPHEFTSQLIQQVFSDLNGILLDANAPVDDAFGLAADAAANGAPRGGVLVVLAQGALTAYHALLSDNNAAGPSEPALRDEILSRLVPGAAAQLPALTRHAQRLIRYFAEAEPTGEALPITLAQAIQRLYQGMMIDDPVLGGRGLIALRTLITHLDAVASLLDPASDIDRPVRAFSPDRFHDHFLFLTEQVQKHATPGTDRPVAALTLSGRITAIVAAVDHPLEAAATAVRERVGGDPATQEHALLRMQGLLRFVEALRHDGNLPFADALHDETAFLSLVTAAATAPMRIPGRFGEQQLVQVARFNRILLQPGPPTSGSIH